MATTTPNNGFILPGVNDPTDQDLWGGYLNENFEALDDLVGASGDVTIPVGAGMDFWGTTVPSGFVFAYGQALNRTTYALLFTAIGTTYGAGDGSTTFNLPDKRDRASFGKGNMGGTAANRITDQSGGWEGDTLGDTGGGQTVALSESNLPSIAIEAFRNDAGGSSAYAVVNASNATNGKTTIDTIGGSSTPFGILPPGIVCNYIIYTGVT